MRHQTVAIRTNILTSYTLPTILYLNLASDKETMKLLSIFGFRATLACDTEDIYSLAFAVLPAFTALADSMCAVLEVSKCDAKRLDFYSCLTTKTLTLFDTFDKWDPTERLKEFSAEENDFRKTFSVVLSELEFRFLNPGDDGVKLAYRRLDFKPREGETYPRLRALKRILPETGGNRLNKRLVDDLRTIIRVENKATSKQLDILEILDEALKLLNSLQQMDAESDSTCPRNFSNYPSRNLRTFTKKLFDAIQRNWCCHCAGCPSHVSRKARLNLTHHRQFETAPTNGKPNLIGSALFRVLFPTNNSRDLEWQDTEISLKNQQ